MAVNALFYRSIDGGSERQADSPNRTHFELRVPHGVKLESHQSSKILPVQGISIRPFPGLENFVPAVVYHFCHNLAAEFSQPGNGLIEIPCTGLVS